MIFKITKRNKIFFIGLSILLITPFIYVTRYAVPSADDFSYAVTVRYIVENQTSSYLGVIYNLIKNTYLSFSGRWFDHFLLAIIYKDGINMSIIHSFLLIVNLMFFFSIYIFIRNLCHLALNVEFCPYFFFTAIIIGLNISSPSEIFYRICGSVGYTLPFSLALLSTSFFMCYLYKKDYKNLALSSILSFISTGGSLVISGFINILLLCFTVYYVYTIKPRRFKDLICCFPFLFGFVGAWINVLAPGTFQRHEVYSSSGFHFTKCLFFSLKISIQRIQAIICHSYFIAAIVIILLIVMINFEIGRKVKFNFHPIFTVLTSVIIIWVSYFPYILGYYTDGSHGIAGRVLFINDWIAIISMIFSVLHITVWYRNRAEDSCIAVFNSMYSLCIVILIGFFSICTEIMGFYSLNSVLILRELRKDIIQISYRDEMNLLNSIGDSKGENIIVSMPTDVSHILKCLELYETDNWVNEAVANYFGKQSITVYKE